MMDAEKINALLKKLETGATCQSDAMRAFDAVKAAAIDHPQGSISRDIFEGFIDDIRDEIEALKAQDLPVEVTIKELDHLWKVDFDHVYKRLAEEYPNGLKIIDIPTTPDHKLVADAHRGNMKGDDHG